MSDRPVSPSRSGNAPNNSKTTKKVADGDVKTSMAPKRSKPTSRGPNTAATLQRRLQVDKAIVDELLLIFSVIGSVDPDTNEFVPVQECLEWLQDLQRAVRRDDDLLRPVSLLLGQWKLMQQKLLPLCLYSGRYDRPLLLTLCKILVILTKPMSEHTIRAGKMIISPKAKTTGASAADPDMHDKFVQEQIWLRENAIQQANLLVDYKKAFCHVHQSRGKSTTSLFSILVSMLAEPLGKSGRRSDQDHLVIELVLHLFCNLLRAQPLFGNHNNQEHEEVHDELVHWMQQELVLDILCVLSADLEHRDNAPYNLLVMELLHHLWKPYHPAAVAMAFSASAAETTAAAPPRGQLMGQLQRERASYAVSAHTRHGHFGGTLEIQKKNQTRKQYMSATQFALEASGKTNDRQSAHSKRKHKRVDVFCPSGGQSHRSRHGPSVQRAHRALHEFLLRFCRECYGPIAKSLKGEFRRDSTKLEEGDKVLFLRFIWFVSHWWRSSKQKPQDQTTCIGSLIFTMDVFTFDVVLRAIDSFQELKQYPNLGSAVAVLSEMMHLLHTLHQSKEPTEHVMALGLLDRLYYASEPLDRLPQIFSKWEPGTTTREYLADVVEICHIQLKVLEANESAMRSEGDNNGQDVDKTIRQMHDAARDFDLQSYIRKRLISVHTVFLYTQLLAQFEHNSVTTNHRIVSFLKNRVSKQVIFQPEDDDDIAESSLPTPKVTLQPLLYQFTMLRTLDRILHSTTLSADQKKHLVPWATSLVYDFSQATQRNPLLWVEALLAPSHQVARHCDQITNVYVSEEFRMLLVKDQLQRQVASSDYNDEGPEIDEEEEELEFEDEPSLRAGHSTGSKRKVLGNDDDEGSGQPSDLPKISSPKRAKRAIEDDDDDDDGEHMGNNIGEKDKGQTAPAVKRRKRKQIIDDDSDSEENELQMEETSENDSQKSESASKLSAPRKAMSQEFQRLKRAVLEDDSSASESDQEDAKLPDVLPVPKQNDSDMDLNEDETQEAKEGELTKSTGGNKICTPEKKIRQKLQPLREVLLDDDEDSDEDHIRSAEKKNSKRGIIENNSDGSTSDHVITSDLNATNRMDSEKSGKDDENGSENKDKEDSGDDEGESAQVVNGSENESKEDSGDDEGKSAQVENGSENESKDNSEEKPSKPEGESGPAEYKTSGPTSNVDPARRITISPSASAVKKPNNSPTSDADSDDDDDRLETQPRDMVAAIVAEIHQD